MDIFISWSGPRSKVLAAALRNWLPKVIQAVRPWISASDIEKGAQWLTEVSQRLSTTNFGLICTTPENLREPWLLFEAGALSKALGSSRVCPILLDLVPSDLKGPLAQFQATIFERDDMGKLLQVVNSSLESGQLPAEQLKEAFDLWWPQLESAAAILPPPEMDLDIQRTERDLLEEVVETTRRLTRLLEGSTAAPEARVLSEIMRRSLSPTEEIVLNLLYGFGGHPKLTGDEIAMMLQIDGKALTAGDINMILERALRKLRHPRPRAEQEQRGSDAS